MEAFQFFKNFIKSPQMIGSVWPSSKRLAYKMTQSIDFDRAKCIVEYGPGTGVFTEELIQRKKTDTLLLVMELNDDLYEVLEKKYANLPNVHIIHDSAESVDVYLKQYGHQQTDYIVSGLPFTAFPKDLSERIFQKTLRVLKPEGQFITFQYTLVMKKLVEEFFHSIELNYELMNLPPAFVLYCKKD